MKSRPILFASLLVALAGFSVSDALATPRAAAASGSKFTVAAEDLEGWHLGGFYRYQSRELDDGANNLSQDTFALVLGHDIFSWISLYGFAGTTDCQLEHSFTDADLAVIYGVGAWVNLIDHELLAYMDLETRVRLQAFAQVGFYAPELDSGDDTIRDTYGALTLSIINDIVGSKNFWPESIGLFFGPVYTDLSGDSVNATGENVGFLFGLDVALDRRVGMSFYYEAYGDDDNAIGVSLNYHF